MTSASTLARKARTEKNPRKAKALRAVANEARRAERANAAKAAETATRHKALTGLGAERAEILGKLNQALTGKQIADNNALAASVDHAPLVAKPWWESEDEIARLKAIKNPLDFKARVQAIVAAARNDMIGKAADERSELVKTTNEAWRISIVCAFLAKCETLEQVHRGMPKTAVIDGLTLARVVDALREAGYTSEGKTGRQWRAVGR